MSPGLALHLAGVFLCTGAQAAAIPPVMPDRPAPFEVDYPAWFSNHDIVYLSPPFEGYEGFPIGNGDLGGMLWCTKTGFRLQINKSDCWDQPNEENAMLLRSCGQLTLDMAAPCFDWLYLKDFEGRLSLYDAQVRFSSETPFAKVSASARVQATRNVVVLQCRTEAPDNEDALVRVGLERWGSRAYQSWYHSVNGNPLTGLGQARAGTRKGDIYIQESLNGLDFAVVCRVVQEKAKAEVTHRRRAELTLGRSPLHTFTVMVAVVTSAESPKPLQSAIDLLNDAEKEGLDALRGRHEKWWSDFWQRSFVHIGDNYLENLYYLHMYLMGSSSRGRYPAMFNGALWQWNHDIRQWALPHHWNMQQAYWSLCAANHPDLMAAYLDTYWRLVPKAEEYAQSRGFTDAILWHEKHDYAGRMVGPTSFSMKNDFSPATQIGQIFWQYYRYTRDEAFLRERAYPFMKKAAEFYLQYLKWDEVKQEFYIYPASPYECEIGNDYRNTITDLSAIRASFRVCIEASALLDTDADKRKQWQQVLDHLAAYPMLELPGVGEVTAIALDKEGKPLQLGGHDYSFCCTTAPVFPAGNLGIADAGSRLYAAAVRRARLHPEYMSAISPMAVVAARLGLADEAEKRLAMTVRQLQHFPQGLFYNIDHWHIYSRYADKIPNSQLVCQRDYITDRAGRYKDIEVAGENRKIDMPTQPFVQCGLEPLAILAEATNEMLIQSHDGTIRVFPAVPSDWPAAFVLRACGAFIVSSEREPKASPKYVVVQSLAGERCRLVNPWPGTEIGIEQTAPTKSVTEFSSTNPPIIEFPTVAGATYEIRPKNTASSMTNRTHYRSEPNREPKYFHEAVLGKPRDF